MVRVGNLHANRLDNKNSKNFDKLVAAVVL